MQHKITLTEKKIQRGVEFISLKILSGENARAIIDKLQEMWQDTPEDINYQPDLNAAKAVAPPVSHGSLMGEFLHKHQ